MREWNIKRNIIYIRTLRYSNNNWPEAGGTETASSILRDLIDIRKRLQNLETNLISKSETTQLLKLSQKNGKLIYPK